MIRLAQWLPVNPRATSIISQLVHREIRGAVRYFTSLLSLSIEQRELIVNGALAPPTNHRLQTPFARGKLKRLETECEPSY